MNRRHCAIQTPNRIDQCWSRLGMGIAIQAHMAYDSLAAQLPASDVAGNHIITDMMMHIQKYKQLQYERLRTLTRSLNACSNCFNEVARCSCKRQGDRYRLNFSAYTKSQSKDSSKLSSCLHISVMSSLALPPPLTDTKGTNLCRQAVGLNLNLS